MIERKVFDCITFWREFDILEIRLNELYDVVDKFIIIESAYTHTGKSKELYLKNNINLFEKYIKKIYLVSDIRYVKKEQPTQRQNYQRNLIGKALKEINASSNDLILISDCDEIPRSSVVRELKNNPKNCIFELNTYISYFNLYFHKWHRGRALLYGDFKGAQKAHRDYFIQTAVHMKRFKFWPFLKINPFFAVGSADRRWGVWIGFSRKKALPIINNAGWHFTKMFSTDLILDSISAMSHTELVPNNLSKTYVEERRKSHKIYYGGDAVGEVVKLDSTFPTYLLKNKKRFSRFIIK